MSVNLLNYDLASLTHLLTMMGEKPFRAKQVMKWIHQYQETDFDNMTDIAKSFRVLLKKEAKIELLNVLHEKKSLDGTVKWLLGIDIANGIETVFIPEKERNTLCISSQIGCALDCHFCSTGKQGFNRNLTTAEIVGQLWWANHRMKDAQIHKRVISNVVMMGMGEPLANYEQVVQALKIMLDDHAYGLSRRKVTVSTSGMVPQMKRLSEECPVSLAVSLHAPNDHIRDEIIPLNKKYPLKELMNACLNYLNYAPRDFITFEYIMLDGVNDSLQHARELVDLVHEVPCKFNLIPFNFFPKSSYQASGKEKIRIFKNYLQEKNMIVTVRKTRGDDIDAACGQLAGKVKDKTKRSERWEQIHLQK